MDKTPISTAEKLFEYFDKKAKKYIRNEQEQEDKRLKQFERLVLMMSYFELKEAKKILIKNLSSGMIEKSLEENNQKRFIKNLY